MLLGWINPEEYSFNCFSFFERFQIRMMCENSKDNEKRHLGIALQYNPVIKWYFENKCPECKEFINEITSNVPRNLNKEEIRNSEIFLFLSAEDFVIYTTPDKMDSHCPFIRDWDKERLLELTDFTDKVVLDIGSGSGRLAFAAADKAKFVYASEPVSTLREYLRDKIQRKNIKNMKVVDCMMDNIPYPDNTFDIVMSGHVWGDDFHEEYDEMIRVVKDNGFIIDCPGDEKSYKKDSYDKETVDVLGFDYYYYKSKNGGDIYRYIKQISK